jgi:hypothetical protein
MSQSSYSHDDDDLFSYDPSTEEKPKEQIYSSVSDIKSNDNTLLNDLSRNIKNNDDETFDGKTEIRVKLAEAILSSYDKWIASATSVAYFSTLNTVLDELTGGRFSVMYFYNTVEQKILRRININTLIGESFDSKTAEGSKTLKEFLSRIGISYDSPYLSTYVGTLLRISNHILLRERAMYLSLAERLQFTPNPLILQDSPDFNEIISVSKFTVTDQQSRIIEDQFIQNSNQEFMDKLNTMNLSDINFNIRSI